MSESFFFGIDWLIFDFNNKNRFGCTKHFADTSQIDAGCKDWRLWAVEAKQSNRMESH